MHIRIWHKLALTLITTALIVLLLTVMLSRWYFEHGFLGYLNEIQNKRIEQLSSRLISGYKENGDWNFLRRNHRLWRRLLDESLQRRPAHDDHKRHNKPPPPHHKPPPPRFALLDANKLPVIGRIKNPDPAFNRPLILSGETIGYLHIKPFKKLTNELDQRFAKSQNTALWKIALLSLACSFIIAWLLSHYFRKRIAQLTGIAHELTAGNFNQQIDIRHNDELGDLGRDINQLAKTLEKNSLSKKQWIADISHELRTPLTIIRGELEALEDGVRPLDQAAIHSLSSEITHLNKLVNDLYQLSLSDLGGLSYSKKEINPLTILEDVLLSFEHRFQKHSLTLENLCQKQKSLLINADKQRLFQLFSNLLENSVRYTDPGGSIRVSCDLVNMANTVKSFMIMIEDSSPGVDQKNLPHLFDRLYRVDSSRNRILGGAGLGLSIVSEIMTAHNGTISASSSSFGGLKITLTFPVFGSSSNE